MDTILQVPEDVRLEAWAATYTGRRFHPFRPRAGDIDIKDIAHGLALSKWSCRFRGQCRRWYSVAQHSVEVAKVVRARGGTAYDALAGLLHDASEAYLPDVNGVIKPFLPDYRALERVIQQAIHAFFLGAEPPDKTKELVREADRIMLATEVDALMPRPEDWESIRGVLPLSNWRGPIPPEEAEREFLRTFEQLQDWWQRDQ